MSGLIQEFKDFINRGSVMDLAVGVIIGGAFTSIVTALTNDIINPLIEVISGGGADAVSGLVVPGTNIDFGAFISACINFLIVAFVVFLLMKGVNRMHALGSSLKTSSEEIVTPPTCPFCKTEVPEGATRCPHCTSEFEEPAIPTVETKEREGALSEIAKKAGAVVEKKTAAK